MSSLIVLALVAFGFIAFAKPRMALLILTAGIPLYILRFPVFGIPTNFWESMVLIAAALILPKLGDGLKGLRVSPLSAAIIILSFAALYFGWSTAPDKLEALGIIKGWFLIPAVYALLVSKVSDTSTARLLPGALLMGSLPLSLMALWQVISGEFITIDGRASAWFVSANYLSLYLVPVLVLSLESVRKSTGLVRGVSLFAWIAGIAAIYLSFSFGGWLGLFAGIVGYTLTAYRFKLIHLLYSVLSAMALGGAAYLLVPRFAALFDFAERTSASVRIQVWATSLLMIKENWLKGLGLGSFDQNYLEYAKRLFSSPLETMILHPHNLFLQVMISTGLPGLIALTLIVIQWGHQLSRVANRHLVPGLVGAMVSIFVHGLVDTTYFKNDLAAIFWLLIGLAYVTDTSRSQTT